MKQVLTFLLITLCCSTLLQAGIYKWVDENGKVHFGDRPPESEQAEQVTVRINTYQSPEISTEIFSGAKKAVAKNKKVVMYGTEWCGVCKKAKRYFKERGIRYVEYDVEKSARGKRDYKKLNGKGVPIILVGDKRLNGFSSGSFEKIYGS